MVGSKGAVELAGAGDLSSLFASLGLAQYQASFADLKWRLEDMRRLWQKDSGKVYGELDNVLRHAGVHKVGHRMKVLQAMKALHEREAATAPVPAVGNEPRATGSDVGEEEEMPCAV